MLNENSLVLLFILMERMLDLYIACRKRDYASNVDVWRIGERAYVEWRTWTCMGDKRRDEDSRDIEKEASKV